MATADEMAASMIANIPEKTGKSLDEWKVMIAASGLDRHGKIVSFLKADHGVTHGFANLITTLALDAGEPVDLVAEQYAGPKAALLPIYQQIVDFAQSLGADVEIAPKKASVSLRRKKQFALITPATKTRIDLGLALKGESAAGRLESYNAMCSHRMRLEQVRDFDAEVQTWLREAYSRAG